jgi:cytochrome P450
MKPDDHAHYRRLFTNALRTDLIAAWETELRRILRQELSDLASGHETQGSPGQRLRRTLSRISTRSLVGILFGVRQDQAICHQLEAGFHRLGPDGFEHLIGPEQKAAFQELRSALTALVHSLEGEVCDGCYDSVLQRMIAAAGRPAVDETVLGNAIYMLEMGRYDLVGLFRWILKYLSDHPRVVDELRRIRSVEGTAHNMAEACVLETLRLDQAEALNRYVTEEFTFEGYRIPRGCTVRILLRETHRDGDIFPDPDRFFPERFLNRKYSPDEYAPFGFDHRCIAAELVVTLSTLFVEELIDGFTWSVATDGPRHRGRHFWEPHPSFAIDLRPRARLQPAPG